MRVALVTAGVHGLGRAITETLMASGYLVVATSRDPTPEDFRWQEAQGPLLVLQQWVPAGADEAARLIQDVHNTQGRLDILVNNAGPFVRDRIRVADTGDRVWTDMVDGNLAMPFWLMRAAIPIMRAQGFGRIINLGYAGAGDALGWATRGAYAAAKAALASLTRTVALEEAQFGITANLVCPSDIKRAVKTSTRLDQQDRGPRGGDVARLVGFLAADASRFVTGQVLELSFGSARGYRTFEVSRSPVTSMLAVGTRVYVSAWGAHGVIHDAHIENGVVRYKVEGESGSAWFLERAVRPDLQRPSSGEGGFPPRSPVSDKESSGDDS